MTDAKLPRPPRDLGHRGRAFWRSMHAQYEVTGVEAELLVEVCRTLDSVERLAGEDPDGAGLRAQRALLGRLMNTLMRDTGLSSVHAQTAARARCAWRGSRRLAGPTPGDPGRALPGSCWTSNRLPALVLACRGRRLRP